LDGDLTAVTKKYSGKLRLKNQRPKYQITHPSGSVASTADVRLRLHYNVQPWVGVLAWDQARDLGPWRAMGQGLSKAFELPAIKPKKEGTKA
jgi:signal peptidase complex subunit 3